ncbi:type IV secretory system conjugative DNA transfer family protein [Patescibacteria group bacterium]|nr:type IV secretory system conjugative DNA transfer family protein [Patescibacteria group bacterium]
MDDITIFGKTNFRNEEKRFGIKTDDRRRHMYIIGKTGVGKSTLLENMIVADIKAGKGVALVDPHGETAEKILDFIPEERLNDVVYFNPQDINFPIAFNPLEQVGIEYRYLVASGIMGVFKKIWPDVWSARMEYILNNSLLALLEYPGSTLLGIMRLLSDKEYRKVIVDNLQDPVVKSFWTNEFAKYTQRLESEATAAIQNKVGQFVTNPLIRNVLGQSKSSIDMKKMMDEEKILIANLSKGKIGEDNSNLLGAMLITKIQLAAMSRVDTPENQRKDFYLYVDEFQNFATDSFAAILSEARKYHLCLIMAHQYIRQLTNGENTKVRDAVFGNVGTMIAFRVGAEDGEFLEKEYQPDFLVNDFVNLPKYNFYTKLMIDGVASKPFSAKSVGPLEQSGESFKDVVIENSRRVYSTPREVIEKKIALEWSVGGRELAQNKLGKTTERPLSEVLEQTDKYKGNSFGHREQERRTAPKHFDRPAKKKVDMVDLRKALKQSLTKDFGDQESIPESPKKDENII